MGARAAVVVFAAWSLACVAGGWFARDAVADKATAEAAQTVAEQRAQETAQARAHDASNAQAGAVVQVVRSEAQAANAAHMQQVQTKVTAYAVQVGGDGGVCLDGDGLQAWREANAGPAAAGEFEHPGRPAGD